MPMRGGAGRYVRPHVAPGPIPTSWGPSLSESWLRQMVTHLLRRATEELHADGRIGSTPHTNSPLETGRLNHCQEGAVIREHPVLR